MSVALGVGIGVYLPAVLVGKRHIMCLHGGKSVNTQSVNTVSNLDKLGVSYAYAFSDWKSAEE